MGWVEYKGGVGFISPIMRPQLTLHNVSSALQPNSHHVRSVFKQDAPKKIVIIFVNRSYSIARKCLTNRTCALCTTKRGRTLLIVNGRSL